LQSRTTAENTEDDEQFPGNILECRGEEKADCEVEKPRDELLGVKLLDKGVWGHITNYR
jgi:hypothetical protein